MKVLTPYERVVMIAGRQYGLVAAGVELPVPQFEVVVEGRRFRLDFAWPTSRLYVEVDGFDTHRVHSDIHRDRRREALLVAAGWTPLHFTETSRPDEIVDRVTKTLAGLSHLSRVSVRPWP
jgi:very-short-patch-repair endonuclease